MTLEKSRRAFLRLGAGATLIPIAGCTTENGSSDSTDSSSPSASTPTTVSPSTRTSTHEPIGTSSNPSDLGIVNRTNKVQRVTVDVTQQSKSESVFSETMEIKPNVYNWRDIFSYNASYSGVYLITVKIYQGLTQTYKWDLSEEPAEGWVYIYIESDNTIRMVYSIA